MASAKQDSEWPKVEYAPAHGEGEISTRRVDLSVPPPNLPVVGRFAGYDILGRLAIGGMAEILLARHPERPTQYFVVKRILKHFENDRTFLHMFLDEARIGMQLKHPNICRFFQCGEADGSHFIAMEWVNGVTMARLSERIREQGGVPLRVGLRIIANVARGLDYAHRAKDQHGEPLKLIHRDVSPTNIAISFHGEVKLLDFGIAKAAQQTDRTKSGVIKGKFAYMAPEQCMGVDLDHRVDIFALGLCLYEVLSGSSAFKRRTEAATMRAILNDPVPPFPKHIPDEAGRLRRILEMALAKKANARFSTANLLAAALEHYADAIGGLASEREVALLMRALFPREFKKGPIVDEVSLRTSAELDSIELKPVNEPRNTKPIAMEATRPDHEAAEAAARMLGQPTRIADQEPAPQATPEPIVEPTQQPVPEAAAVGGGREFELEEDANYQELASLFGEAPGGGGGEGAFEAAQPQQPVAMAAPVAAAAQVYRPTAKGKKGPRGRQVSARRGPPLEQAPPGRSPRALVFVLLALFVCVALFGAVSFFHRQGAPVFGAEAVTADDHPILVQQGGQVLLASSPPGASVYLDGDLVGITPASLPGVSEGTHALRVKAPGFSPWTEVAQVKTGETAAFTARLTPKVGGEPGLWGTVNLTTAPESTVYIAGDRLGKTPLDAARVPAGRVLLEFRLRSGRRVERRIHVRPGQTVTRELTL